MKKTILLLFFLAPCYFFAQDIDSIEFGANLGLNISTISDVELQPNASTATSFNIGIRGEYYLSEKFGVKVKLNYDSKGWSDGTHRTATSPVVLTPSNFKLDYLTIPIMASFHLGSENNWYLDFGPYLGILLSADAEDVSGGDVKDEFKSDFGLGIALGYKFEITRNASLFVELDGQASVVDISDDNDNDRIRNSRGSLNFGILFGL